MLNNILESVIASIGIFEQKEKFDVSRQIMEGYSSSDSNISIDSLEKEFKKKSHTRKKTSEEGIDTILVPFYEKDVYIKVPKDQKCKNKASKTKNASNKLQKESLPIKNYLVNKDVGKKKQTSYLEMFRKQFSPPQPDTRQIENEVRSISPEFGDTERESFREDVSSPATDFFNTECYNEMYYDKLMNQEINNFLEQAYADQLKFTNEIRTNSPENIDENNLRSVSDVSQPRRNLRRATVQPVPNVKLGGLGPDMENIRPRLERARSLQRYSEKVRMENRVKIYKKSVQEEIEKKAEKEMPLRRQESAKSKELKGAENSFLINKNISDKAMKSNRRICYSKSKSANVKLARQADEVNEKLDSKNVETTSQNIEKNKTLKESIGTKFTVSNKERIKSCGIKKSDIKSIPNQDNPNGQVPPVQISFLVNMGGLRPSSALRTLEAKHRMYQERVKEFAMNNNNNEVDGNNN